LLDEASNGQEIQVRRFSMPGVPRGPETSVRIADQYLPFPSLFSSTPELLIVTGSNPIEVNIEDEPYWSDLVDVLSWARERVPTALLSCLSAHAATTIFDGVERTRLPEKRTGVFSHQVTQNHVLTSGMVSEVLLPHSRWNSVSSPSLKAAGYDIIIDSDVAGWTVASREQDGRQLVLVQGHPEYDPSSLLREYRRDAGRYVRGERDDEPCLPLHCVASQDWKALEAFHSEIVLRERDATRFGAFDFETLGARAPWPWHTLASQFFTNLVASVVQEKD
jgi:homoserine O-succinyltransferase